MCSLRLLSQKHRSGDQSVYLVRNWNFEPFNRVARICTDMFCLHTYLTLWAAHACGSTPKLNFRLLLVCFVWDLQCDLLDMPAVKQLEKDTKYAPVYRLLEIFLTGRLSNYLDFHGADSNTLKTYGMCASLAILPTVLSSSI